MELIDYNNWDRREIFDFFSHTSNPFYAAAFNIDVTKLYSFCHENRMSFYYSMAFICTKALNSVENFRYVINGEDVYLCNSRIPSCTDIPEGSSLFHIVTVDMCDDIIEFCRTAKEKNSTQKQFIDMSLEGNELIYFSCLPKVELTAITNEMNLADPKHKDDSVPRLAWGKYTERNGRKVLNISMEVNHRLIDGVHIGMFVEKLEEYLGRPEQFAKHFS